MSRFIAHILLFAVFPSAIIAGGFMLADYSYRPGPAGEIAQELNSIDAFKKVDAEVELSKTVPTLIIFYHPHCPCTVATFSCLERLSPRFSTRPKIIAYAYCPENEPDSWINSALTTKAQCIPGLRIYIDRDAEVCRQVGVKTSGHVLLYDEERQLVFNGGITPGRGHEGDCRSALDLLNRVNGMQSNRGNWPVFGCRIVEAGEQQ